MRTIITFLNDKGLKAGTTYAWQGREYEGGVFSLALRQFVAHDRMLVCNTPEAQCNTWPALRDLNDPRIIPVPIPKGENTAELWEMFERITTQVNEGETVIFDITHGLRSLPFLVFLFAAYLKSAKRVQIEAIYYGALELGKPAPVIDLSEFVSILDWLTATDQFVHTGDARFLAKLLTEAGQEHRGAAVREAGAKLEELSLAMMLCRPLELMEKAGDLGKVLEKASHELSQWTPPFTLLADRIQAKYAGRALAEPTTDVPASLAQQLALVDWYLEHNQVIQAMTLAREWVVTAIGWQLGNGFVLHLGDRQEIEWAINSVLRVGQVRDGQEVPADTLSPMGRNIWSWDTRDSVRELWNSLLAVRNDLDHAGMSNNRMRAEKLARKAREEVWPRLQQLAAAWGIWSHP